MTRSTFAAAPLTRAALAIVTTLASAQIAGAQSAPEPTTSQRQSSWELIASSGALVATGVQRDVLKDAPLSTAQLSYVVRPQLAITATLGWARSRDLATAGAPKLDVFTYDVGAEARAPRWLASDAVTFTPFAGAGVGARSYDYRRLSADATHNLAGYGAVGGELGMGRVRLRMEVRDYVTGFTPLAGGGSSDARNDVVALVGLRITKQRARQD